MCRKKRQGGVSRHDVVGKFGGHELEKNPHGKNPGQEKALGSQQTFLPRMAQGKSEISGSGPEGHGHKHQKVPWRKTMRFLAGEQFWEKVFSQSISKEHSVRGLMNRNGPWENDQSHNDEAGNRVQAFHSETRCFAVCNRKTDAGEQREERDHRPLKKNPHALSDPERQSRCPALFFRPISGAIGLKIKQSKTSLCRRAGCKQRCVGSGLVSFKYKDRCSCGDGCSQQSPSDIEQPPPKNESEKNR